MMLNGLAFMNSHRRIIISDPETIINMFDSEKKKKKEDVRILRFSLFFKIKFFFF